MQWRTLSIPWTSGFCLVTVIYHIDTSVVTGKYRQKGTTRKIHTKLHLGPEWRAFHILTRGGGGRGAVIEVFVTVVCANSQIA